MQIRFNIPILQEEEVWKRNEEIKHWGNYIPLVFKNGKPTYILPNHLFIFTQTSFHLLMLAFLTYDYFKEPQNHAIHLIRLTLLLFSIVLFFALVKIDPGICSRGDPIINQSQLSSYKNFCTECKCMQTKSIIHCSYCNVCIEDRYAHISMTNMCITKKNYLCFILLFASMISQTLLIL